MSEAGTNRPVVKESGPRLADMLEDLLFPKFFRAVTLALRPERLFIGLMMVVLFELVVRIPSLWLTETDRSTWESALHDMWRLEGGWDPLVNITSLVNAGWALWGQFPWSLAFVKVFSLLIVAYGGCMLARMAACDMSRGMIVGIGEAQAFTIRRYGSVLLALVGPVLLGAIIALFMALSGWVLLSIPFVNVLGGALYFLFLLGGAVIVVILVAYYLGLPMLIPAVACEGSDGIDAIGRVFPYVLSRPVRLLGYVLLATAVGWIAITVAFAFAGAVQGLTERITSWLLSPRAAGVFARTGEVLGGGEVARRVIALWVGLVWLLAWGYAVAYAFSASTILYLVMRRLCDGQDLAEVWMPGMVEGAMAESMRGRAEVTAVRVEAAGVRVTGQTGDA